MPLSAATDSSDTDFDDIVSSENSQKELLIKTIKKRKNRRLHKVRRMYRDEEEDPYRSSAPNLVYEWPKSKFEDTFLAIGFINNKKARTRSEFWLDHIQWSRRTNLIYSVPEFAIVNKSVNGEIREEVEHYTKGIESSKVLIKSEHTVLATDRVRQMAQVVLIEANSSEAAVNYLRLDPLYEKEVFLQEKATAMSGWHAWRLDVKSSIQEDPDQILAFDVHSPFIALVFKDDSRWVCLSASPCTDRCV